MPLSAPRGPRWGFHRIELPADGVIAGARGGLEALAIENPHAPFPARDQVLATEFAGGDRHRCPPDAQHPGQERLRQLEVVRPDAVMDQEQPPRESLALRVQAVAETGL